MGPEGGKALSSLYAYGWHWVLASMREYHTQYLACMGAAILSSAQFPSGLHGGKVLSWVLVAWVGQAGSIAA